MGEAAHIQPPVAPATWRATTPISRLTGALTRHGPSTRDELVAYTGDPRDLVDTLINELLVDGLVVPVLDRYRIKSPRERYEREVSLHDGTVVGSWSPEYLREGEARQVLGMPTKMHRAGYILRVRNRRGDEAANALEALITSVYRAGKAAESPNN